MNQNFEEEELPTFKGNHLLFINHDLNIVITMGDTGVGKTSLLSV